jgi:predicted GNAT family N-acyltransferase
MLSVSQIQPDQTKELRHLVLWPHLASVADCSIDIDDRQDAIHLGTFHEKRIVAIGSFFELHSTKINSVLQYRLRAMASDPSYRGMHAGKLLVEEGISILRSKGVDALWCDARLNAVGFYSRLGFQSLPEVYEVPLIGPHKFMWIELHSAR